MVIMSSENILTRIDRYRLGYMYFFSSILFYCFRSFHLEKQKQKHIIDFVFFKTKMFGGRGRGFHSEAGEVSRCEEIKGLHDERG